MADLESQQQNKNNNKNTNNKRTYFQTTLADLETQTNKQNIKQVNKSYIQTTLAEVGPEPK